jgi:hypothetical protein
MNVCLCVLPNMHGPRVCDGCPNNAKDYNDYMSKRHARHNQIPWTEFPKPLGLQDPTGVVEDKPKSVTTGSSTKYVPEIDFNHSYGINPYGTQY